MNNFLPLTRQPQRLECSPELLRLGPTPVFDALWTFAAERQAIFFRRQLNPDPPWTTDPILNTFKFTNVYRASDRVSQYLIGNVIYSCDLAPKDVIFRILLFKLFNKIETWERLEREVGQITTATFSARLFDRVLTSAMERGEPIYSAAYIMPPGSRGFQTSKKHVAHLGLLEQMLKDNIHRKIMKSKSLQRLFQILRSYPMLGDFLAYQYAIDINYSEVTRFSESEFVVPGPGARSGIRKCFTALGDIREADVIRLVTDLQDREFSRRDICFQPIGDRRLQLIDIQNVFCEIGKYARVRFPESLDTSMRTKIKQRFRPHTKSIEYWYPPKWGINEKHSVIAPPFFV